MSAEAEEPQSSAAVGASPPVRETSWSVAGHEVRVVTGGEPPAVDGVPGAGVASLRISPDLAGMLRWLETDPDALPRGEALLVELGAGHGLLGLACAALRPEALLVLTDVAPLLAFGERSLAANDAALAARAAVRPLQFGDAAALDAVLQEFRQKAGGGREGAGEGDGQGEEEGDRPLGREVVCVGSGISYWECVYTPLAETLARVCSAGGRALLGYFKRDWKVERGFWTKVLPRHGLQAEVLWEGEIEEPEDAASSAPACTRTPGEWTARVYSVQQAPAAAAKPAAAADSFEWQPDPAYANKKQQQKKGKKGK